MTEVLLRMLLWATAGMLLVLSLRRPARSLFGAGPAFVLWLLPLVLALAPLLPRELAPTAVVVLPGLTVTPHAALAVARNGTTFGWQQTLLAIWLAGAAFGLARLVWQYARLRAGAKRGSMAWLDAVRTGSRALDANRVRVHADGPAVLWSLPRSLLLLPEDFAQRFDNVATRELVLRHELTHAQRGDAWWSLAMELASALLWFHPLAWIARVRFRLDQELACDAASLRATPQRTSGYARALLDSIAVRPLPALIPWLAEPQLKERLAMLARRAPGALRRRFGFVAVGVLLAGGLLIAGGQTPVRAATQALTGSTPPSVDINFKNQHPPRYPVEALKKGEQGVVVLDVKVDAFGKVQQVAVDPHGTTAPASLQAASVAAAKGWRFNPGSEADKPVGGTVKIPVQFSLTEVEDDDAPATSSLVLSRKMPAYPVNALRNGDQGMVMLRLRVAASGDVTKVLIDKAKTTTSSAELQAAAVTAAEHWKLKPAQKGGKAVAGWQTIPVNFSLADMDASTHKASARP